LDWAIREILVTLAAELLLRTWTAHLLSSTEAAEFRQEERGALQLLLACLAVIAQQVQATVTKKSMFYLSLKLIK